MMGEDYCGGWGGRGGGGIYTKVRARDVFTACGCVFSLSLRSSLLLATPHLSLELDVLHDQVQPRYE